MPYEDFKEFIEEFSSLKKILSSNYHQVKLEKY
jgi:hypothetical protein